MRRPVPVRRSTLAALLAFVALAATGCGGATAPRDALDAARSRWALRGPAAYTMVVAIQCECVPGSTGPVEVAVRDGIVESRRYLPAGTPVPAQFASSFPTVEGLFARIESGIRSGTTPAQVEYAPLGYPTRFAFGDPAADAPLVIVTDFHAR